MRLYIGDPKTDDLIEFGEVEVRFKPQPLVCRFLLTMAVWYALEYTS